MREKSLEWLERALFLDPEDPLVAYNAACTYAQLGESDKAFEALDHWAKFSGSEQEMWIETDPDLDSLRSETRFTGLKDRLKQRRAPKF